MRTAHRIAAFALAAGVVAAASGCAGAVQSSSCVDWVVFDTPADAAADADAIMTGTVVERARSARLHGVEVGVWTVRISSWDDGDGDDVIEVPGEVIDVISSPRTCEEGSPYPDGDPLDAEGEVMLFLHRDGSTWSTITGFQGVLPAPADGGIPAEWPDGPTS